MYNTSRFLTNQQTTCQQQYLIFLINKGEDDTLEQTLWYNINMKTGIIDVLKYYNGVTSDVFAAKYKSMPAEHLSEVGMIAFGQIMFISIEKILRKSFEYSLYSFSK